MYKKIEETIEIFQEFEIAKERMGNLNKLSRYIQSKISENRTSKLNFICTHNSRRSHLAQIWAQVAAYHFGFRHVLCFSGGTEATAMYAMIKSTLEKQGFEIISLSEGDNPVYAVKYSEHASPVIAFSKVHDHPVNPSSEFAAIMTCDHADSNCPIIQGAEIRIPITYIDPKVSDGTNRQEETYLKRSLQIASEMFYVFQNLNK